MPFKVTEQTFTYEQTKEFLTNYWYWNPQDISCFEEKYFELVRLEHRMTKNPRAFFYRPDYFFAFSSLFGEEFFTLDELVEFCTYKYRQTPEFDKPTAFRAFYEDLRKSEPRMPSAPEQLYSLSSIRMLFGLEEILFFNYQDARVYCIREYESLPKNRKPKQLTRFYKKLSDKEPMLPSTPSRSYKGKGWVSYRALFDLENIVHLSYEDANEYCSEEYKKAPEKEKPTDLKVFYSNLRKKNSGLPSSPDKFYVKKGWVSWGEFFGLEEKILFSYEKASQYCSGKYSELPEGQKPKNLTKFYLELRKHEQRLPWVPRQVYLNTGWVSYIELFNANEKIFFTYKESVEYCTQKYEEYPANGKPQNLRKFYKLLKASEPKLSGSPEEKYKNKGWKGIRAMFGIA